MSLIGFDNEDLKRVLSHISTYAETEYGREFITDFRVLSSRWEINLEQKRVVNLKDFLRKTGFSIPQIDDIRNHLYKAAKVDFLTEDEVGFLFINIKELVSFINKYHNLELNKLLEKDFIKLREINDLLKILLVYLNESGKIKPESSPELLRITQEKDNIKETIHQKLEKILSAQPHIFQDRYYTIRDGRYVLPLKISFKKDLKGTIKDTSQSGDTIFVEPESITEINDRYILILKKEEIEKRKILIRITAELFDYISVIKETLNFFGYIDSLMAKVRYLLRYDLNFPTIMEEKGFYLNNAFHPLFLEKKDVVKNDFIFPPDKNIFLITGPNGGGKTVSIKTISMIIILSHAAIPVPVSDRSYLPVFSKFCFDMGDRQNIDEGVSSFTSKMLLWKQIIDNIDENIIVFIDELGNFTNPEEGSAISISFIDEIIKNGGKMVAGTHLDVVKEYVSVRTDGLVSAMLWNDIQKKPTFQISYGTYSGSFAIEVLRDLGFNESFIKKCEKNLSSDYIYIEELKKKREKEYYEILKEKERLDDERKRLQQIIKEKEELIKSFKEEKYMFISQAKEEINRLLERMDRDIKALPKNIKLSREYYKAYQNESRALLKKIYQTVEDKITEDIKEGDQVYLINLGKEGKVIHIDGDRYYILTGVLKIWVDKEEIRKIETDGQVIKEGKREYFLADYSPSYLVIDLRGKRVDEAINILDKFIDRAYLSGAKKVKIVHGAGEGKLRENIHGFLKSNKAVSSFSIGNIKERGGSYYTIVELK